MNDSTARAVHDKIGAALFEREFVLVAIDGRCGAGKTTLAARLKELCKCEVIHMDHFFPRLEQRTAARLNEPGGNLDRERFLEEVIAPLKRREAFSYRPYNPQKHEMDAPVEIGLCDIIIIEGSYSCHPALFEHYDLRIFLTVGEPERLRRIKQRNGDEGLAQFQEKWIPMEEHYFSAFSIEKRCDLWFDMGGCPL
ncbi:MAG: uridine kinase [Oscillospiraceae bacterium]|nr:uridine kinase [Oscillospiraceae bacterium]